MTSANQAKNSILPDVDRRETAACHITTESAVTSERVHAGSRRSTGPLLPSKNLKFTASEELREANEQFIGSALRYCRDFPGADIAQLPGLVAAWRNTPVPISNAIFLSSRVKSLADWTRRVIALTEYLSDRDKPPMFLLCNQWMPQGHRRLAAMQLSPTGLMAPDLMIGMATDELSPARRSDLHVHWRHASDDATRTDFADINSAAYGFPVEAERAALCVPQVWGDDGLNGYVGYLESGLPATAAGVMVVHNKLHVVCVATRPEYMGRGFAEATIRHALQDMRRRTGLRRTTLSATEAGAPLYARMGYHETATFLVYRRRHSYQRSGEMA